MVSEPPRSVGDDVDATGNSGHHNNRIVAQENEVTDESNRDKAECQVLCADDQSQASVNKDNDKWKPVVDASEKDTLLMPPPGGFLRSSAGETTNNITDFLHTVSL